jgi:NADH:ubiquinone oxidoreductase subunit 2 (subunit N)
LCGMSALAAALNSAVSLYYYARIGALLRIRI